MRLPKNLGNKVFISISSCTLPNRGKNALISDFKTSFKLGELSLHVFTFMLLIKIRISFAVHLFLTRELGLQKLRLFSVNYGMFQSVFETIF